MLKFLSELWVTLMFAEPFTFFISSFITVIVLKRNYFKESLKAVREVIKNIDGLISLPENVITIYKRKVYKKLAMSWVLSIVLDGIALALFTLFIRFLLFKIFVG